MSIELSDFIAIVRDTLVYMDLNYLDFIWEGVGLLYSLSYSRY